MTTTNCHLILRLPNVNRGVSDEGWRDIDAKHIEYWQQASRLLGLRRLRVHDVELSVLFDWQPVVTRLKRHYRTMDQLFAVARTPAAYDVRFPRGPVHVSIEVEASGARRAVRKASHLMKAVAQSCICDAFLIMNLAAPGSCNFYRATLHAPEQRPPHLPNRVSFSELDFDVAHLRSREGVWMGPAMIALEQVATWYVAVRSGVSQVPQNRMEKVLFALLQTSSSDDLSPPTVIWLFYALETLFDTKPGENFRTLISRAELLLTPDAVHAKQLRTELRKLYDLRSAFVHGGLDVMHVMHNEFLDARAHQEYTRIMHACQFGFSLLLTSIQCVIGSGWREPIFVESVKEGLGTPSGVTAGHAFNK